MEKIGRHVGYESIDVVAGGETAGIPFAAWIADRMLAPMAYVRKKPKGFGRNALIEGDVPEGKRTLLVEDLTTDGAVEDPVRPGAARRRRDRATTPSWCSSTACSPAASRRWRTWTSRCTISAPGGTCWKPAATGRISPTALWRRCGAFLENPVAWSAQHGGIASAEEAAAHKASG